jgi:hypothetical protein
MRCQGRAFVAGMLGRQVVLDVRDHDSKMDKVQAVVVDTPNRAGGLGLKRYARACYERRRPAGRCPRRVQG